MYASPSGGRDGPSGYTYGVVLVRADRGAALDGLREIRFSGWVAPAKGDWTVAVAASGAGTVATGRRGVLGVGEWLATRTGETVLALRVLADRQLVIAGWSDGTSVGQYVSDPSVGRGDDTLADPLGVEHARAFAVACGRSEVAEDLTALLGEDLDPDSVIESERLERALRLLGLPRWPVSVSSLPHDVPAGPPTSAFTRLGAGSTGLSGRVRGRLADVVRRRRRPPPAVADPPRGRRDDIDPWLL